MITCNRSNRILPRVSLSSRAPHILKTFLPHNLLTFPFFLLCLLIAASHQLINLSKYVLPPRAHLYNVEPKANTGSSLLILNPSPHYNPSRSINTRNQPIPSKWVKRRLISMLSLSVSEYLQYMMCVSANNQVRSEPILGASPEHC